MNKQQFTEQIRNDWIDNPAISDACFKLFDYIESSIDIKYIYYSDLNDATNNQFNEKLLLIAAKYLCASGLLEMGFHFLDNNDEPFIIEFRDLIEARNDGYLTHPKNGIEKIRNFEDCVFYFFSPTAMARSLK